MPGCNRQTVALLQKLLPVNAFTRDARKMKRIFSINNWVQHALAKLGLIVLMRQNFPQILSFGCQFLIFFLLMYHFVTHKGACHDMKTHLPSIFQFNQPRHVWFVELYFDSGIVFHQDTHHAAPTVININK